MAEPLNYRVPRTDATEQRRRDAYRELDELVVSLHEHGVLRLLRDVSGSLDDLGRIGARQVNNRAGQDALGNLYILARLLGQLPARDLRRVSEALSEGFAGMSTPPSEDKPYPPGVMGAYRLLKDEELWNALGPLVEGLKAFSRSLSSSGESRPGEGDEQQSDREG